MAIPRELDPTAIHLIASEISGDPRNNPEPNQPAGNPTQSVPKTSLCSRDACSLVPSFPWSLVPLVPRSLGPYSLVLLFPAPEGPPTPPPPPPIPRYGIKLFTLILNELPCQSSLKVSVVASKSVARRPIFAKNRSIFVKEWNIYEPFCRFPSFPGEGSPNEQPTSPSHYNRLLLPESQTDRLRVVLVRPRNPLNIGAVARAMANFGLSQLAVVAAYAPHWREAKSAVGAPDLLKNAAEFATLAEAVVDCTLVAGTGTLTWRKPEQKVLSPAAFAPLAHAELARGGHAAIVFGPEKHGLTREDLSWCHVLIQIPTDARQPSMNLGQAVAVCLYELAARDPATGIALESGVKTASAASGNLDLLAGLVEQTMQATGYSPKIMEAANRHDLRLLLRRLALTPHDIRRILGIFRRILWKLNPNTRRDPDRK